MQPLGIEPKYGAVVTVRTRDRQRTSGTAQILEVGAQLDLLPLSMQSSIELAETEMALPVNISLPNGIYLLPGELGELVDINVLTSEQ